MTEKTHAMWIRVLEDMTREGKYHLIRKIKKHNHFKILGNIEKEIDKTSKRDEFDRCFICSYIHRRESIREQVL